MRATEPSSPPAHRPMNAPVYGSAAPNIRKPSPIVIGKATAMALSWGTARLRIARPRFGEEQRHHDRRGGVDGDGEHGAGQTATARPPSAMMIPAPPAGSTWKLVGHPGEQHQMAAE